jgi:hypothetical protein
MHECESGTGKQTPTKRVSVRSGGAGHAHSGIIKTEKLPQINGLKGPKATQSKIVRLGR